MQVFRKCKCMYSISNVSSVSVEVVNKIALRGKQNSQKEIEVLLLQKNSYDVNVNTTLF